MYNRYVGNTGRYYRVDDPQTPGPERAEPARTERRGAAPRIVTPFAARPAEGLRKRISIAGIDIELSDLILLLMLFLLFIDSGDEEFLMILGFLALTIFKK
ncbi:MAG: hypothetical protein LBJ99_04615 [Oscillospiraceae bacterium]|jgi:hypothetical protein|nr:hypothetical protein [Oscillospiraceae bacterium]